MYDKKIKNNLNVVVLYLFHSFITKLKGLEITCLGKLLKYIIGHSGKFNENKQPQWTPFHLLHIDYPGLCHTPSWLIHIFLYYLQYGSLGNPKTIFCLNRIERLNDSSTEITS